MINVLIAKKTYVLEDGSYKYSWSYDKNIVRGFLSQEAADKFVEEYKKEVECLDTCNVPDCINADYFVRRDDVENFGFVFESIKIENVRTPEAKSFLVVKSYINNVKEVLAKVQNCPTLGEFYEFVQGKNPFSKLIIRGLYSISVDGYSYQLVPITEETSNVMLLASNPDCIVKFVKSCDDLTAENFSSFVKNRYPEGKDRDFCIYKDTVEYCHKDIYRIFNLKDVEKKITC